MTKTIGEKILELRKARSLTQEKLGEQLGISGQAVSKWENDESMPDIMILPQLCEILGISIDALLEVPHSMKKENIMKIFCDYSNEVGSAIALFEAFSYIVGKGEHCGGISTKLTVNCMELYHFGGMGFTISNKEFMDSLFDYDIDDIISFFSIYSDKNLMTVIKELSINTPLSKDDLTEKTKLSQDELNSVLMTLMENKICSLDYNDAMKRGYLLTCDSQGLFMLLATYFFKTTKQGGTGISTLFSRSS